MTQKTIRSVNELLEADLIASSDSAALEHVTERYAVAITPTIERLIDRNEPNDPIAAQFVPKAAELVTTPEELDDPIGDEPHSPVRGIVHRYKERVLLKIVGVCPVYCRFCFRREMVGPNASGNLTDAELDNAIAYVASQPDIWEVILTGGDPLVLSPRRLRKIAERLAAMSHVRILRVHTRVPVVSPELVTQELIEALKSSCKTVYVALHANHPRELTPTALQACKALSDSGIVLVSQSVLLKGVNDDVEVLAELFRRFVENRIKPYYLHHPDMAPGTGHFRLSIDEGQRLLRALRRRISGLCLPAYILDLPGGHGKVSLGEGTFLKSASGQYTVEDRNGERRSYPQTGESIS